METPRFTKLEDSLSKLSGKEKRLKRKSVAPRDMRSEIVKELETTGRDISFEEVTIRDDGLFELEGEQIVIYIKDNTHIKEKRMLIPSKLKKIHFRNCSTIRDMTDEGTHGRYISTQRKTGWYLIDTEWGEIDSELFVCKNCLDDIGYNGYSVNMPNNQKNEMVKAFNINEFFETHESRFPFTPRYNEHNAPSSTYTKDWHIISRQYKKGKNWICEECKVNLSSYKRLLDTHHRNRNKSDNKPSNLKALCKTCHRKEPFHSHMSTENDGIIERLRKEQGIN